MVNIDSDPPAIKPEPKVISQSTLSTADDEYDRFNLAHDFTQAMIDAAEKLEKDYNTYKAAQAQVPVSRAQLGKAIAAFDEAWKAEQPINTAPPRTSVSNRGSTQTRSTPLTSTFPEPTAVASQHSSPVSSPPTTPRKTASPQDPPTSPPFTQVKMSPETPGKAALRGTQPPPATPLALYTPFPAGTPGATVRLSDFRRNSAAPSSQDQRCYLVYVGQKGAHGIYNTLEEACSVVGEGNKNALIKRFPNFALAEQCYDDCLRYDVFKLLAERWTVNEYFVVLKGVVPGVYCGRGQLMKCGLRWRGGEVIRVLGSNTEAKAYFTQQVEQGMTVTLPSIVPEDF